MFMQEIKKKTKSLENKYEGLEYMQEAFRDQGIKEGMKKWVPVDQHVGLAQSLAEVEVKCQRQAEGTTQTKQVPPTPTTAQRHATISPSSSVRVVLNLFVLTGWFCDTDVAAERSEDCKSGRGGRAEPHGC